MLSSISYFWVTRQILVTFSNGLTELILAYLVYSCTENKIAFFIPLQGKNGTFMLAKGTGKISCREKTQIREQNLLCPKSEAKTKSH